MSDGVPAFIGPYVIGSVIMETDNAIVYESFHPERCAKLAVKCIKKSCVNPQTIETECAVMRELSKCKYTIEVIDILDLDNFRCIVMPLALGGDLFEYIARNTIEETTACQIMYRALNALKEVHEHDIWHRDIKPENFLLMDDSNNPSIVLADFGYAKHLKANEKSTEYLGTPLYSAPEIHMNVPYTRAVDIYSMGVTMYVLLSGESPFSTENDEEQRYEIVNGLYDFDSEPWDGISEEAKDLIRLMMAKDPSQRISIDAALNHPWFVQTYPEKDKPEIVRQCAGMFTETEMEPHDDEWFDNDEDEFGW